jgi:hypothetical protein
VTRTNIKAWLGLNVLRVLIYVDVIVVRILTIHIGESVDGIPAVDTFTL